VPHLRLVLAVLLAATAAVPAAEPLFETCLIFPNAPANKPNYRIPAILQAPNGDLLIIAEKRNDGIGDIGNHDIVCKRSSDKGKTWSAEQVIFDDENRTSTDLTVGIDRDTGKIWLFFLRDKKKFTCFTSTDSGATWLGPTSVHEQVIKPEWDTLIGAKEETGTDPESLGRGAAWARGWAQRYGIGPGNAIVHLRAGPKKGRLIVPARHREDVGRGRLRSFAHCFYSDDHGATWKLGGTIGQDTSECQFVELATGEVMVVSRNESSQDSPDNLRHLIALSPDGGESWGPIRRAEELITPRCHGSTERLTLASTADKNRLLFSSPASPFRQKEHPYGRYNLSVRLSYDEGATWTAGKTIWPHPSSYSDFAVCDDHTIAYVYERAEKGSTHYWDELHFARFNLEWLTDGRDSLSPPASQR
jgi:sialidase-1